MGGGGSRIARAVIGWSPESCSRVAGLPRLMIVIRLRLPAGPAVGTAGMSNRAVVGGNQLPLGMLATPTTHWECTIGSSDGCGCLVARCWSTTSLSSRVASVTTAFTKDCTSCSALCFFSVTGHGSPDVGVGGPSEFSATVTRRVLTDVYALS